MKFRAFNLVIVLCSLVACFGAESQTHTGRLKGTVMDPANAPIQHAYVLLHRSHTTDVTVQTDERGQFAVDLSPGLYDIFVASDGFTPSCKVIKIIASKAVHRGFVLQIDMEHMQVDPVQTRPPVNHR